MYRGKPKDPAEFGTDFVYGGKIILDDRTFIVPEDAMIQYYPFYDFMSALTGFIRVVPDTVGQAIRMVDIKGVDIYQGDWVTLKIYMKAKAKVPVKVCEVKWADHLWGWCFYHHEHKHFNNPLTIPEEREILIVGNITDHPDFLEEHSHNYINGVRRGPLARALPERLFDGRYL